MNKKTIVAALIAVFGVLGIGTAWWRLSGNGYVMAQHEDHGQDRHDDHEEHGDEHGRHEGHEGHEEGVEGRVVYGQGIRVLGNERSWFVRCCAGVGYGG